MTVTFAWHVHHDRLIEPLTEPLEVRQEYIRTTKPANEQELRLRLLQPVRGVLPPEVIQAGQAYGQALQAYEQARRAYIQALQAYEQARQAYEQALKDHADAIDALHAQECPNCPWDGRSILGEVRA